MLFERYVTPSNLSDTSINWPLTKNWRASRFSVRVIFPPSTSIDRELPNLRRGRPADVQTVRSSRINSVYLAQKTEDEGKRYEIRRELARRDAGQRGSFHGQRKWDGRSSRGTVEGKEDRTSEAERDAGKEDRKPWYGRTELPDRHDGRFRPVRSIPIIPTSRERCRSIRQIFKLRSVRSVRSLRLLRLLRSLRLLGALARNGRQGLGLGALSRAGRTAKSLSYEIPRQSRGIKSSSNEFKLTFVERSRLTAERSSRKRNVEPRA